MAFGKAPSLAAWPRIRDTHQRHARPGPRQSHWSGFGGQYRGRGVVHPPHTQTRACAHCQQPFPVLICVKMCQNAKRVGDAAPYPPMRVDIETKRVGLPAACACQATPRRTRMSARQHAGVGRAARVVDTGRWPAAACWHVSATSCGAGTRGGTLQHTNARSSAQRACNLGLCRHGRAGPEPGADGGAQCGSSAESCARAILHDWS